MQPKERETMVKIRLAIIFIIAQVVLTKYTSRRYRNRIVEDRAIRYNRNIEANCLSNSPLCPLVRRQVPNEGIKKLSAHLPTGLLFD